MIKLSALLPGLGVGIIVGMASGLLGIGGGILMVPALVFLWHRDMQTAVGTSIAVMIPSALAGTVRHAGYGNVDWRVAGLLGVGAVAGSYFLGAPLAEHIPSDMLKKIFGLVMCLFGLQMVGAFDWIGKVVK